MKYLKLVFCLVLAVTYSNLGWASSCEAVEDKVLEAMAKALDVNVAEIAIDKSFYEQSFDTDVLDLITVVVEMEKSIGVELKDEDVVDPMVYFDKEELVPRIKDKVIVREFQETIYQACVNSLG
ncbi:phosphopantetheine-binding protein [Motilimonas eburnea]|uniref:phosphopantetheine-binding protein n=1 Tax=Motilimonas eburnea TaxID=1737488 RepID=UPI001E51E670|nr:phosphopantetheine-binding protein [Motilimonas eburnea]MCE2573236.1 acyl carrier protein [Motilimonas eburnea]